MNDAQMALRGENVNLIVNNKEVRIIKKDGTQAFVSMNAVPKFEDGVLTGAQVSLRDITTTKKTEIALKESEEKFRSFVENANEIVYSLTPDGIFSYVSPKLTELLGYEISEIIGKSYELLIHPDDYPSNRENFINARITGDKMIGYEYRVKHKDGTWQWHSQRISPICDEKGNIIAIHGISHDITQHRKSEEIIRRANRQLSLLSGITRHDILNKISVILGYLALLEMDLNDPVFSEILQRMKIATNEIKSQIEFTRIYQDLGSHEPQWIYLDDVMPRSSLPDSVNLTVNLQGILIFADLMLEKVFLNLLDNSIRHGQWVTEIRISTHESDDNLMVVWEDNGVGIPLEEKEKIFERGFGKNTGLGMFLVREILSLTGISIIENGIPGKGARFEIILRKGAYRYQPQIDLQNEVIR